MPSTEQTWVSASGEITVRGQSYRVTFNVPAAPVSLVEMVPLFHGICAMVIEASVQDAESGGRRISCGAGCAACCRQIIPVTQTEARRIARIVDAWPEPQRSELRQRFARARDQVARAGLTQRLQKMPGSTAAFLRALAIDFQRLNIACPFLIDERCGIYAERPLRCREYMMTSPPVHCSAFDLDKLTPLLPAVNVARLLNILETGDADAPPSMMSLIYAIDWADAHPDNAPLRTGPEHVETVLGLLRGGRLAPSADPSESDRPR